MVRTQLAKNKKPMYTLVATNINMISQRGNSPKDVSIGTSFTLKPPDVADSSQNIFSTNFEDLFNDADVVTLTMLNHAD